MRFIQVRELLRGPPESILKEIKDPRTQQGRTSASGEEGRFDREQVKRTSPPPSFMVCSKVLRTREADDGEVHPKGSLPTQDEK